MPWISGSYSILTMESDHRGEEDEEEEWEEDGGSEEAESEDSADAILRKRCHNKRKKDGQRPRKKRAGYHLTLNQKSIILSQHDKTGFKGDKLAGLVATLPEFEKPPTRQTILNVINQRKEIEEAMASSGG